MMQLNITHLHKQKQKRDRKIVAEGDFQKAFLKNATLFKKCIICIWFKTYWNISKHYNRISPEEEDKDILVLHNI